MTAGRTAMRPFVLIVASAVLSAAAAAGDAPPGGGFSLPLRCEPGVDCWVMNYPDTDKGAGAKDHACGPRSYDGHKGTDFAIRDMAAMRAGVPVTAAASGTVLRVRDGIADRLMRDEADSAAVQDRDCGNGLVIEHGAGWQSQYCHMRNGSLAVKPGETVARGQALGLVGASGRTEFPHVHITIRKDGEVRDPATGRPLEAPCGPGGAPLWDAGARLAYQPSAIYAAGFAAWPPSTSAIKENAAGSASLPSDSRALVLWATLFGVRKGDRLMLEIVAPDGSAVTRSEAVAARDQSWRLQYGGRKLLALEWPPGIYNGRFRLLRPGLNLERRVTLRID
ncbi:MAG: peptidoglycan DD-metalloendopeptidase family protein [Alphaproteobacteria bacterium]|nr:peptidoglycan DD-metalloendopeptidase family protein [Alphaproteobacteria bacterium]